MVDYNEYMQVYYEDRQFLKQKKGISYKFYLTLLLSGLLGVFIFYIIAYSSVFHIRNFSVVGSERFSNEAVISELKPMVLNTKVKNFLGINNLLVWGGRPDVAGTVFLEANIERQWVHQSVVIKIKERTQFAVWCRIGDCYWIDEDGTAFEEAPQTEGSLILTVHDNGNEAIMIGREVVEGRYADNLIKILNGILDMGITVRDISYNQKLQEITAEMISGPDIYLSVRFDPSLNLTALQTLKEKVGLRGINYIDLRVENRIYYK